jgi:PAS domain-containing protein
MKKAKIFVISQDVKTTKLITETLEKERHWVTSSSVPKTSVTKCREEKFDLVFINVDMHRVDYGKLISSIKKVSPHTVIIIITMSTFPDSIVQGEALEIDGYLIKPLTAEKIRRVTDYALHQARIARENRKLFSTVSAGKKQWEATVDAVEEPIFVTDFDFKILRANLATFRALQKGVHEVIGQKCYEIFHCSDAPLDDCPGKRARDSGEPVHDIVMFKGLKQRLSCTVYPQILASGGGLAHFLREPPISTEKQAEVMTKYERIFDDAVIPILLIDLEDNRVIDANRRALELFRRGPEEMANIDLEDLFVESFREQAVSNIIKQTQGVEGPLKVKILDTARNRIDAHIIANLLEIGDNRFAEIFVIPFGVLA